MGVQVEDKIAKIKILLKVHPKGLTITDISSKLKINRNSAAKYLEILQISGMVESKSYGTARVFFLTHRLPISALVSISSDLVVTLDENHRILFVNDSFCRLFKVKNEEAAGSHIVDIFRSGIGREILPEVFSDGIADQEKVQEVRLPGDDGDLFFKIKSIKTVFDDGSRGITIIMEDVTREKRDTIELEAKEARYRGIIEDQTDFVIRFVPLGTLSFVNTSFSQALKKKPDELLGRDFSDTLYPADRPVFERCIRSLNHTHPVAAFECRLAVPGNPVRWIAWTLRAMFNGEKTPVEYQAVGRDITEKKAADDKTHQDIARMDLFSRKLQRFIELPAHENIYQEIGAGLSEILPDAVIAVNSFDSSTNTVTVRAFFCRADQDLFSHHLGRSITGLKIRVGDRSPPDGFFTGNLYHTGKNLFNTAFQQIPEDACSRIEDALNLGDFYSIGLISKDALMGNITFALRKGQKLDDKSLIEAYARAASISLKRLLAENELKESEILYRTVIENIQDVFYRTDTRGNLIMASPSWAEMLGYDSPDECLGRNIAQDFWLVPKKREDLVAAITSRGYVTNYEVILKKKNGSPICVSTNSHIYYGDDGNVLGIEGIFHDISDRKAAEKKVYKYISEMEFLSQKLVEFIDMDPSDSIYAKIVSDLKTIIPGAMVLGNSFDPQTGCLTVRSAAMSDRQQAAFVRHLGRDLTGCGFLVNTEGRAGMRTGKLQKLDLRLYDIAFGTIPEDICTRLEADLDFSDFYVVGFVRGGELLGNAAVFVERGGSVPDFPLVEMYAREAAIAIQRHTAEEARRKSDEIFYNIAHNSPVPIALIDTDGTYRYINNSFIRLFGYDRSDFRTGREWFDLAFPDPELREQAVWLWKLDWAQNPAGYTFTRTFAVRTKDSGVKDVIFRPVVLSDGKICVVYEDITERKKAEQTHRLLSSIIESTSDAVIGKDSLGMVISWNRAAERLYGYTENEMRGKHISQIIPDNRRDEIAEIAGRIKSGKSISNLETQRVRKDGVIVDVSVTISPLTDESGAVIGASTIARDITSCKAEKRLRENEDQYRSLVDNISVGMYRSTGDPAGRFIWGNSSLVRILGYPSLDWLKEVPIADMFVGPDGRKVLLDDLKKNGFVKNREIALRRADGETVCVLVTALARFDARGDISCINGIVQDISCQRRAEQRIEQVNREMEDILAFISDPIVITNCDNVVVEWNAAMEQLTGIEKCAVVGRDDVEHLFPFYTGSRPPLYSFFDAPDTDLELHYPGAYRSGSVIVAQIHHLACQKEPPGTYTLRVFPLCDPQGERIATVQIIQPSGPAEREHALQSPPDSASPGTK